MYIFLCAKNLWWLEGKSPIVADPEFYNGGGCRGAKGAERGEVWGGGVPLPRNFFLPETGGFWCILGLLFTFKKA